MRACQGIIDAPPASLVDLRHTACGFDFSSDLFPGVAIEIKGLKLVSGGISFTEREWAEAQSRRRDYWVVVVGNLAAEPISRIFSDPISSLDLKCQFIRSASTVWSAQASVV